jgi:hypothetical protein
MRVFSPIARSIIGFTNKSALSFDPKEQLIRMLTWRIG